MDKILPFTKEELKHLHAYIISAAKGIEDGESYSTDLADLSSYLFATNYDPYSTLRYQYDTEFYFDIFFKELRELPLFINDSNDYISGVAKWRLFIGK